MKVWAGYGSEHSSNLVIIGEFKTAEDANTVANLIAQAEKLAEADEAAGNFKAGVPPTKFSDETLDFIGKNSLGLSHSDIEQLIYEFHPTIEGNKLIITTEEYAINVFISMMVQHGAKVQVYSAHDYKSPYGRPTAK